MNLGTLYANLEELLAAFAVEAESAKGAVADAKTALDAAYKNGLSNGFYVAAANLAQLLRGRTPALLKRRGA